MKKIISLLLFIVVVGSCARSTPKPYSDYKLSSGFSTSSTDSATLDNLEVLCRVWGFVKYHHPVFADSIIDIDSSLFDLLPRVAKATSKIRNKILLEWVESLGRFDTDKPYYQQMLDTMDYEIINEPEWINDKKTLGRKLSRTLTKLRYTPRDSNYYAALNPWAGNLNFDHEKDYQNFNDCGYRLLSFFRYWNIIEYFFPYKPLMDRSWDTVLREYMPEFINPVRDTYYPLIARLTTELDDSHATTGGVFDWRRDRIDLGVVENKLIVLSSDKFAKPGKKELMPGDEIVEIDGKSLDSIITKISKYLAHSNQARLNYLLGYYAIRSTSPFIMGSTKFNSVKIKYMRNSVLKDTTVVLDANKITPNIKQEPYKLINDSIGYIYAGKFDYKNVNDLIGKLKNTKGIVVDLRCYPSAFLIDPFIHEWILKDSTPVAIYSFPLVTFPGYFIKRTTYFGAGKPDCYQGKIVVMVNDQTVSNAEYTTMAFQAGPRTTVIGSQTQGADGNISRVPFLGGQFSNFSGLGVYYPDGGQTQRVGIRIDEIVEPTIEGIKAGRDEVLERAIEIINE